MPPVATAQSSRAGMITALIVAIVIAVAMIVVAVYEAQQASNAEKALVAQKTTDRQFLPDNPAGDARVSALRALSDQQGSAYQGLDALSVAMTEADQLAKLSAGDMSPDKAIEVDRQRLASAGAKLKELNDTHLIDFTLPQTATLTAAVNDLTQHVSDLAQGNKQKDEQLAAAQQKVQNEIKARDEMARQKDEQIAKANERATNAESDAKRAHDEATAAQQALQASADQNIKQGQQVAASLTTQLQQRDKSISDLNKQVTQLKSKLHLFRVNPNEPIVQNPDGTIIRLTDSNTVFINIGQHQSVTKGLTFEVYDKNKGIPPLGDGMSDTNMPVGKASIEVFSVGPDTSECRVIKIQSGEQLVVGDLISNLVYDPTIHYNFVVYGDFDLSNSGTPSPGDAEIVKRLITQWGGRLQDNVDVDTDFVVMGAEPTIPAVSADQSDPQTQIRIERARQHRQAYDNVLNKAAQLTVPIMNQNRFLYFIGYYDQAKR